MEKKDDFASLMDAASRASGGKGNASSRQRLRVGQTVSGPIVQIGAEYVFVDVGARTEARMSRAELVDKKGELSVKVGDTLTASVVSDHEIEGPVLAWTLGQSGSLDHAELTRAQSSGLPVEGVVRKVTKGGLEVTLGQARAFCPASQIERTFVQDLSVYEGQTLRFKITEIRDGGKSIVVSRRALLDAEQEQLTRGALERIHPGMDVEGSVTSLQKYGAFVDLGGLEGLIHISELSSGRIDRVEDVLSVGERVTVRVLGVEQSATGARIKLSLRALKPASTEAAPNVDEVLIGTVSKHLSGGIVVDTPKGSGFVPMRELGLSHGADPRRALAAGKQVQVVLMARDPASGRLTFSIARVSGVEERMNYAEFSKATERPAQSSSGMGSLGELLREKLGLEAPVPQVSQQRAALPVEVRPREEPQPRVIAVEKPVAVLAIAEKPPEAKPEIEKPRPEKPVHEPRKAVSARPPGVMPVGVVRREKR